MTLVRTALRLSTSFAPPLPVSFKIVRSISISLGFADCGGRISWRSLKCGALWQCSQIIAFDYITDIVDSSMPRDPIFS